MIASNVRGSVINRSSLALYQFQYLLEIHRRCEQERERKREKERERGEEEREGGEGERKRGSIVDSFDRLRSSEAPAELALYFFWTT